MPHGQVSSGSNMCLYILAIFLPFVAVALKVGSPGVGCADLLINICLDILGWIPGVVHAWWVIGKSEKAAARMVPAGPAAVPARY
ncbi:hypothetical protein JCM10213_000101 [Rhodosporidiobolus nylandii]